MTTKSLKIYHHIYFCKMDEFKDLIAELSGKRKPVKYTIRVVISEYDNPRVVSGDVDWLINDMVGSNELYDILDKKEFDKLPSEFGVYSVDLLVQSYKSNHPEDPSEWEMNMWLENIKLEMKL